MAKGRHLLGSEDQSANRLFGSGIFPVVGKQGINLRRGGGIDANEDIFKPLAEIHAVGFAGGGEGIKDGEVLSAGFAGGEKRVFPDQRYTAALSFGRIIVEVQFGVVEELSELLFDIQSIVDGFGDRG